MRRITVRDADFVREYARCRIFSLQRDGRSGRETARSVWHVSAGARQRLLNMGKKLQESVDTGVYPLTNNRVVLKC